MIQRPPKGSESSGENEKDDEEEESEGEEGWCHGDDDDILGDDEGVRYLFNAKELDEETGYYYYGARYYDARVSVWLGVDPLSDKYPGLSPFAYTANNPITIQPAEYSFIVIELMELGEGDFRKTKLKDSYYLRDSNFNLIVIQ